MYGGKFEFKIEIYRFSLFYFVFEDNFLVQAPWRAYIWGGGGDLTEGFLRWGAYTWRGLFSEFYGIQFSPIRL